MNNKGQTLLAFVLLLPVFIIFMAFVCDTGLILKENTKLNNLTKTILRETKDYYNTDSYEEKINELFILNQEEVDLQLTFANDSKTIEITKNIPSVFGNVIGLKTYEIKVKYKITKDNDIIIEKE